MAKAKKRISLSNNGTLAVVLGAGATRACDFVDGKVFSCLPPLDGDFFTQLQRVPDPKHRILITSVMKDMVELFGSNFTLTLETAFTTIEHTLRMLNTTKSSEIRRKNELNEKRDRLMEAICVVLEASLTKRENNGRSTLKSHECKYHKKLVQEVLQQRDHIISFNYDCIIDDALLRNGSDKWNPHYGYGFRLGPRGTDLTGDSEWTPELPASKETTIHLHKLHGSLHFKFREPASISRSSRSSVALKARPYTKQRGTPRFSIIPPESNKAYNEGLFAGLWRNAAQALYSIKHIVVIGYSFPITDLHAASLFRTSVYPRSLKSLVVVNPDKGSRRRAREVLQAGLNSSTRVISFDSIAEFLATDTSVWRGED